MFRLACGVIRHNPGARSGQQGPTYLHTYITLVWELGQENHVAIEIEQSFNLVSRPQSRPCALLQMLSLRSCLALLFAVRSLALNDACSPNTTCVVNATIRTECAVTSSSDFEFRSHSYYSTNLGDDGCAHPTSDWISNSTTGLPTLRATTVIPDTATATCLNSDPGSLCGGSCCAVGQYCYAGETCMDARAGLPTPTLIAASSATETSPPQGMNATTTSIGAADAASTSHLNSTYAATGSSTAAAYTGAATRSFDATGLFALVWASLFVYALFPAS